VVLEEVVSPDGPLPFLQTVAIEFKPPGFEFDRR